MIKISIRKICAVALCGMMLVGGCINSKAYQLYWTQGAPTNSVKLTDTATTLATGKNQIIVKSTRFSSVVKGAYANATGKCGDIKTDTHKINSTNTYYLDYQGASVPKKGKTVTVSFSLKNYSGCNSVNAAGSISA